MYLSCIYPPSNLPCAYRSWSTFRIVVWLNTCSKQCRFSIITILSEILCPKVYPLPYTSVLCPSGRRYGSTCVFSCDNNTAINGQPETQCEKEGAVNYYGQWTFGDYQPYCTCKWMDDMARLRDFNNIPHISRPRV